MSALTRDSVLNSEMRSEHTRVQRVQREFQSQGGRESERQTGRQKQNTVSR